jgi:hypothetical protein
MHALSRNFVSFSKLSQLFCLLCLTLGCTFWCEQLLLMERKQELINNAISRYTVAVNSDSDINKKIQT